MGNNPYIGHNKEETIKRLQDLLLNSLAVNGTLLNSDVAGSVLAQICTAGNDDAKDLADVVPARYTSSKIANFNSSMKQILELDELTDDLLEYLIHTCDVAGHRGEQFKFAIREFVKILKILEELWDTQVIEVTIDPSGIFLIVQTSNLQPPVTTQELGYVEEEFEEVNDDDDETESSSEYF